LKNNRISQQARHLRTFYVIAITQVLSQIGSRMTGIALGIRVFQDTGNTTPVLLTSFFSALPLIIGGSFAGVLVDHWKRRTVLIITDSVAALCTALLMIAFFTDRFALWQLYSLSFITGIADMFQRPASEASTTMLVPDQHRDRANAVRQLIGPMAGIIAPVITGFLYALINVTGIMIVDLVTFLIAVGVVLLVTIPEPKRDSEQAFNLQSFLSEFKKGIQFLLDRKVVLYLLLLSALLNFLLAGPMNLNTPYLLTLTGSEAAMGVLQGVMNAGMIVGGVLVMLIGVTKPRIHGIMLGMMFRAVCLVAYGLSRSPLALGLSLFFVFSPNTLIDASNLSLIQQKTPAEMQGRIFSIMFQLMYLVTPFSYLVTGLIVDRWLEPAVSTPGWRVVAPLVGARPGSGMGLWMVVCGVLMFFLVAGMYAWPKTRTLERDLPDAVVITAE